MKLPIKQPLVSWQEEAEAEYARKMSKIDTMREEDEAERRILEEERGADDARDK